VVAGSVAIEPVPTEHAPALFLEWGNGQRTLLRDGLRLGRSRENEIVLRDGRASRRHARIVHEGPALAIEDTGSSNGTFVDGRRVERALLTAGATLTIGSTLLHVRGDAG
jgi:pSer/pThr/pTyr-binding forkhead associated (FHA) protein